MTTTTSRCASRRCPGELDADGFCRKWGHECAGAAEPSRADPVPARQSGPAQSERHWERTRSRPWEHAAELPEVEPRDPMDALAPAGPIPLSSRRCGSCKRAVSGTEGFCEDCGARYSFWPPLAPGDLVADRYLVQGCLGYGGIGWVFLARALSMENAWVVLKGLREPGDPAAAEAFLGERRALINHRHQRIVAIYDVVPAGAARGGPYLVMEFLPGGTLEKARAAGPAHAVDVVQALGFGDQILDAFEFLHGRGLLYCDLKPDNLMRAPRSQEHDRDPIKLIDFGAVRRIDDRHTPPWGTAGLQAPEVQDLGPAGAGVRSDLYTVGRTLIALTLTTSTGALDTRFPPGRPLHGRAGLPYEIYLRLLDRATAPDPARRFGSATEMRVQLQGVLRQLRAARTGQPEPVRSTLFGWSRCEFALHVGQRRPDLAGVLRQLPMPLVNSQDPAAAFLASLGVDSAQVLEQLARAPGPSDGVFFRRVRAHLAVALAAPTTELAAECIDQAAQLLAGRPEEHHDWALWWHRGLIALVAGRNEDARTEFEHAFGWLPGEVSARLAYAFAAELCGDVPTAAEHYGGVWATDREITAAGYGLARCLLTTARGPDTLAAARHAADIVGQLAPGKDRTQAELDTIRFVLGRCADRLPAEGRMFGVALNADALGAAFETRSRGLAGEISNRRRKVELVDAANRLRPVSWW